MLIFLRATMTWRRSSAEKSLRDNPDFLLTLCSLAASDAFAGRLAPARKVLRVDAKQPVCASPIWDISPLYRRAGGYEPIFSMAFESRAPRSELM